MSEYDRGPERPQGTPAYHSFLFWSSDRLEGITPSWKTRQRGEPTTRPPVVCEACQDSGEVPNPLYHPEDALDGPYVPCPRCSPYATGDGLR